MTEEEVKKIAQREILDFLDVLKTEAKRDPTGMAKKVLETVQKAMVERYNQPSSIDSK
ncbi:MAG: hypothetical protein ACR2LC_01390 [Pyrinomonadaceae bacterium]|jgi:hypothetical protein